MACECVSKHKSWLLILMMIHSLMVWQTRGVCIEEQKKALLEIKASLIDSYHVDPLPAWVDDGSSGGRNGDQCCEWERVTCNAITGHVTDLYLSNVMGMEDEDCPRMWLLNVSLFLHFKELTSLNLSKNCLNNNIVSTGLERLSSLKNLKILDLSDNNIENDAFSSLGALPSLRVLNLGYNKLEGYFPALAIEDLEILDLSNHIHGTFRMQGFERISLFKKLKVLKLFGNNFNKSGFVTSLSALPLLKALDLTFNDLTGSFPATELAHLISMEKLDLSGNMLNDTPSIQDCRRLSRLTKLETVTLRSNNFDMRIILCLSAIPSLRTFDLSNNLMGGSFPIQELAHMTNLEELDLSYNNFNDTPSIQDCRILSRLKKLKSITHDYNKFNKSIILCLNALPSLKTLVLSSNRLLGDTFPIQEISGLKELETLDLSYCALETITLNDMSHPPDLKLKALYLSNNFFSGTLPMEGNMEKWKAKGGDTSAVRGPPSVSALGVKGPCSCINRELGRGFTVHLHNIIHRTQASSEQACVSSESFSRLFFSFTQSV